MVPQLDDENIWMIRSWVDQCVKLTRSRIVAGEHAASGSERSVATIDGGLRDFRRRFRNDFDEDNDHWKDISERPEPRSG